MDIEDKILNYKKELDYFIDKIDKYKYLLDQGKKAKCPIKDFEVFEGVEGEVTFLKEERKGSIRKYKELGKMHFDGVWPIRVDEEETVGN